MRSVELWIGDRGDEKEVFARRTGGEGRIPGTGTGLLRTTTRLVIAIVILDSWDEGLVFKVGRNTSDEVCRCCERGRRCDHSGKCVNS